MSRLSSIMIFLTVLVVTGITGCVTGDDGNVDPTDPRAKFIKDWKVDETCTRMNYTVSITADPGNSLQVLIDNFGNPGPGYDPAVGLVVSNTITVSSQNIGEGWTVSGQGTYQADGSVKWTYTLIISGSKENCTATYTPVIPSY